MSTPAAYSPSINNVSSNVSVLSLPIVNKSLTGVNVVTLNVNNGFLDINAITGLNSSITISRPGLNPITYSGVIRKNIHLSSDYSNTIPFIDTQTVTVILNAAPGENILVKQLTYKGSKPIDYKKATIILFVFFILTFFFE